ncbi:MAG: hypothetical protein QG549_593 [Patescibacteria group bacterium]|nr:hypothetical protein [Patescibacteria group bacterium]
MAEYETYTHKGKDYKFRVGRETPKLEMFELRSSKYYKDKQKALEIVLYQIGVPPIVLLILWLVLGVAGVSLEDNFPAILGFFAIIYILILGAAESRISKAVDFIGDLKEKAVNKEYVEAYNEWIKNRAE